MKRRSSTYIWTDGIVHGFLGYIPTPDAPLIKQSLASLDEFEGRVSYIQPYKSKCILSVTSNGKVWSYAVRSMIAPETISIGVHEGKRSYGIKFSGNYLPRDSKYTAIRSLSSLTSEYRAPLEWAKKDISRRAKLPASDPNALQLLVAYDTPAPENAVIKLAGPFGPITYSGYGKKVGHYTMEQIHQICSKGVADGSAVWTWRSAGNPVWKPSFLEIMLHSGKAALGLAYAPGTGKTTNKRTISLNKKLFELYDAHSIWRVVVHEICHHYRDEVFARNEVEPQEQAALLQAIKADMTTSRRSGIWWHNVLSTHDATFVRELGRVDSKIKDNAISGLLFTEYADPSLVAEVAAKKAARLAAKKPVQMDVAKGRLYVDRMKRGVVLWWLPLTKGDWNATDGKMTLTNPGFNHFINRLGDQWGRVRVTYSKEFDDYYRGWSRHDTLEQFALMILENNIGYHVKAQSAYQSS